MLAEASFLLTVTMKQQTRVVSVRIGDLQRNLCIFKLKTGRDSEKESRPVCVSGAKERIEQCDLMQKNSADVSAICGKEGDYTGTVEYNAER